VGALGCVAEHAGCQPRLLQAGAAEAMLQALRLAAAEAAEATEAGQEAAATAMVATALEALYQLAGDDGAWRRLLAAGCMPPLQALLTDPWPEPVRQRAAAVLARLLRSPRAAHPSLVAQADAMKIVAAAVALQAGAAAEAAQREGSGLLLAVAVADQHADAVVHGGGVRPLLRVRRPCLWTPSTLFEPLLNFNSLLKSHFSGAGRAPGKRDASRRGPRAEHTGAAHEQPHGAAGGWGRRVREASPPRTLARHTSSHTVLREAGGVG
jgi:hypothetical protein